MRDLFWKVLTNNVQSEHIDILVIYESELYIEQIFHYLSELILLYLFVMNSTVSALPLVRNRLSLIFTLFSFIFNSFISYFLPFGE
jgi:hypothetical protein